MQKACCNASNILLFECMTDDSDKTPELFRIPSSGLASAGFCFIWRGLKRAEKLTAPLSMTILSTRVQNSTDGSFFGDYCQLSATRQTG